MRATSGRRLLPLLLLAAAGSAAASGPAPAREGPRVSVQVRAIGRAELDTICPLLEGRLLVSKEPGESFKFVAAGQPAEFDLLLEVVDLTYSYSEDYERTGADADSNPDHPKRTVSVGSALSLDITLSRPGEPESIYEDSLDFTARRPLEPPEERLQGLLLDDMMSRAAEKIPKVLRKRVRS